MFSWGLFLKVSTLMSIKQGDVLNETRSLRIAIRLSYVVLQSKSICSGFGSEGIHLPISVEVQIEHVLDKQRSLP